MTEHFTRNTESMTVWCNLCNKVTEHAVSDERIGRCKTEHNTDVRTRAQIPAFNIDDNDPHVIEVRPGALRQHKPAISMTDRRHIAALDGAGNRGEK